MASIHGISVKGMKKFLGHEGEPLYQGNLYLGNKKIGFWSQDAHGGVCDNFVFDAPWGWKMQKKLNEWIVKMNADKAIHGGTPEKPFVIEYDLEHLLSDYISLSLDEKEYKKAVKAGFSGILIASDGFHCVSWRLPERYTKMTDEKLLEEMNDIIVEAKRSFFKEDKFYKHTVKIYRSPEDFTIGKPIALGEITCE